MKLLREKHPFFWVAVGIGIVLAGFYVFAAVTTVQYGTAQRVYGFEYRSVGGTAFVSNVFADGPADGALQPGDRILAINGDRRAAAFSVVADLRRQIPPNKPYLMQIERDGEEYLVELQVLIRKSDTQRLVDRLCFFIASLAFGIVAVGVGALKPREPITRLFCLAFASTAAFILVLVLTGSREFLGGGAAAGFGLLSLVGLFPINFAVLYHFYYRFPPGIPKGRIWSLLEAVLYALSIFFFSLTFPRRLLGVIANLCEDPIAVLLEFSRFTDLPLQVATFLETSFLYVFIISFFAICAVSIRNYRLVQREEERRRIRWIIFGSVAGLLPFALFLLLVAVLPLAGDAATVNSSRWMSVLFNCATVTLAIPPIAFGYAVANNRVFDTSFVLRRGVRYLLASRGFILIESVVAFVVLTYLLMGEHLMPLDAFGTDTRPIVAIVATVATINLLRAINRRVMPAIDRKFFREAYDAQQIIAELTHSARVTADVRELLEQVVSKIQTAFYTENITVFLRDDASGEYVSTLSSDYLEDGDLTISSEGNYRLAADSYVVKQLGKTNRPLEMDFRKSDAWVQMQSPAMLNGHSGNLRDSYARERSILRHLRTTLLLPLATKDATLGVIALGPRLGDLPFSREDEKLLMSVAGQLTFALENSKLLERMLAEERRRREIEVENRRRSEELAYASRLQLSLLPKDNLHLDAVEVIGRMRTATEVGGDYYDYFKIDEDRYCIALGDATGHGVGAGLVVGMVKMALLNSVRFLDEESGVRDLMGSLNSSLKASMSQRGIGMGLSLVILDTRTMAAEICSTGIPYPCLYRHAGQEIEQLELSGPPLGLMRRFEAQSRIVQLAPGDSLIFLSDGFHERLNRMGQAWGYDRVTDQTLEICLTEATARGIADRLFTACDRFAGNREADDDMTALVLRVKGERDEAIEPSAGEADEETDAGTMRYAGKDGMHGKSWKNELTGKPHRQA